MARRKVSSGAGVVAMAGGDPLGRAGPVGVSWARTARRRAVQEWRPAGVEANKGPVPHVAVSRMPETP
ncbi:hypothetical protein GCM10010361_50820 [Streptomyces olivaceiscleroticus]|uniref:Uncharacterized protein n=1 Tax=Streptomyces olivaceiscleroticus TaxID=68245 RepID=A0ABP3KHA4_9ACTN